MAYVPFALVCLCAALGASEAAFAPILNTRSLGQLVGSQEYTEDGIPYYSFKGLRYAQPPVGPLRFQEPREAWPVPRTTLVNATAFGPSCVQIARNPATLLGEEDCLSLNVYTPSATRAQQGDLYPVIVYIHDGAFTEGNATNRPDRLVVRGIVVVTIQYRVGVLGFLSSGNRDLPGNYGLLDQQLALRWIQQNIVEFCGDRNRVTIAGLSAGGASTTLHMVSPGSRGLFQRVIASSGVFLNPWVLHTGDPEKVRAIARTVGCPCVSDTPVAALLSCLRLADANRLAEAQLQFQGWHENPIAPFGPVIDRNFVSEDPFKFLNEGNVARVPVLLTDTLGEEPVVIEIWDNSTALAELDRNWIQIAPLLLNFEDSAWTERDKDFTSSTVRSQYLGRSPINNSTLPQLIRLSADRNVLAGIDTFAKTLASARGTQPVYMYLYSARDAVISDLRITDVSQILPRSLPSPRDNTQPDRGLDSFLVDIWESFIRTGVPTTANFPVWNPVPTSGEEVTFLNITSFNTGEVVTVPELGSSSFWRRLPLLESGFTDE